MNGSATETVRALRVETPALGRQAGHVNRSGPESKGLPVTTRRRSETLFSTADFVEAWSRAFAGRHRPFAVSALTSGMQRAMYGVQTPESYGLRSVSLGPASLYASPGWDDPLELPTLTGILDQIMGIRTTRFTWNVRFDHEPLAAGLKSLGIEFQLSPTHVLYLDRDYERIFAAYHATTRNHIRRAYRQGVTVRVARSPDDINAYYRVHTRLAETKGGYSFIYPIELFTELTKLRTDACLLVAECEGRVIAGGLFFQDGCSVMYWHGASDRNYSRFYPFCAVLDQAIRLACETRAAFFNLGGSAGVATLERFKSSWGARPELNWAFEWTNAFWSRLSGLKASIRKTTYGS